MAFAITTKIHDVRLNIRSLIENLRVVCGNLRPPTIDSLRVGAAITSFANDWASKTNIETTINIDSRLVRLPEGTELSIYRIVREVLHNVEKHANATKVNISLKQTSPRSLLISISDNGIGLPNDFILSTLPKQGHFRLLGVSERVVLVGGNLGINNLAGAD